MKQLSVKQIRNNRRRNRSKRNNLRHPERLRLVVFRSNKNISAQLIDDFKGVTLASASSLDKKIKKKINSLKSKTEASILIGELIAKDAIGKKIKNVVFDRNGYPYHGRVKAMADSARKNGLKFWGLNNND